MPRMSVVRFAQVTCVSLVGFAGSVPQNARAADGWPAQVEATYDVEFNGINVGSYAFSSTQDGHSYKLNSSAKLSLLFGAIHWTGDTQASGHLVGETAKPKSFGFTYQAQSKVGSTRMAFAGDTVTQVLLDPPPQNRDGVVPVQPNHLKGVLDPLSAVLAISAGSTSNPCNRHIPVYDGMQRFDLVLAPKGQVAIQEKKPSGQPINAHVCQVRYIPISGYKPDDGTKFMAENTGIEIVLRPLPNANIYLPYQVTIPTIAGSATLIARRVNITTSGQQQIALSQ